MEYSVTMNETATTIPRNLSNHPDFFGPLILPDSVSSIGERAFADCSNVIESPCFNRRSEKELQAVLETLLAINNRSIHRTI